MTISKRVQKELVLAKPADVVLAPVLVEQPKRVTNKLIKVTREAKIKREEIAARTKGQAWTPEEHARFLEALQVYPSGPWEAVAEYVGTKNSRQTMTHAQKYRQKFERQQRGLRAQTKHKKRDVREQAAPYSPVKTEQPMAITVETTPEVVDEPMVEVESPRSGEDECEQLLKDVDLDIFATKPLEFEMEVEELSALKIDGLSAFEQIFQDFDPSSMQIWSTNSLSEKFDELSALPEDFSQTLGLWVP